MVSPPRLYPTDLSDAEWMILEPLIPAAKSGGRPPKWTRRQILDGIFYLVRSGCHWRLLPREFPPWKTVYHYFRAWRIDGTWERLNTILRERERSRQGRDPQPSGCIMDSQSARTTSVGGIRGYDGGKKLSGRKRHLLVDTLGLVLTATVHAADIQDRAAVPQVLQGVKDVFGRLAHIWLDQGYTGAGKAWIEQELGWSVEIVKHAPRPRGCGCFPGRRLIPPSSSVPRGSGISLADGSWSDCDTRSLDWLLAL
jgi:putative transposase